MFALKAAGLYSIRHVSLLFVIFVLLVYYRLTTSSAIALDKLISIKLA